MLNPAAGLSKTQQIDADNSYKHYNEHRISETEIIRLNKENERLQPSTPVFRGVVGSNDTNPYYQHHPYPNSNSDSTDTVDATTSSHVSSSLFTPTSISDGAAELQHLYGQAPTHIQAEDRWDDADSAFDDETQSYTTSLKSSVTKFEFENGRRYHAADGTTWHFLPNDDKEMDRLDLFHHIMHLRCDERLYLAPIHPYPQRILDLGTGTGIWAVMMGDLYPSASVLGNDLSPIQPTLVPPNVTFEVDDMEKEWCYNSSFDYIHCRYLAGAIRDWPKLMGQAYE